jgi:nucleotide-binding universal stress UspA family protein
MTIVVGYLPAKGGRASLDLAAVLARSGLAEPVAVVTVVPPHWTTPSMAKVDAEFAAWAHQQGEAALDQARQYVAGKWPDVQVTFHQGTGRSVPSALLQACADLSGDLLVLGSSTDGRVGQIIVGSTATPLLHSSEVPVAIAPRGYRAPKGSGLGRLTCSFSGTHQDADLLTATAQMSVRLGCPLRIVTFGVRGHTMYPPEVGLHAEDQVLVQWKEQVRDDQRAAVAHLADLEVLPDSTNTAIATGGTWAEAIDDVEWGAGEILVVGSSPVGHLARVFLGSGAIKIVRYSPVPVVVVPAAVAAEAAEAVEAEPDKTDPEKADPEKAQPEKAQPEKAQPDAG